MLGSPCYLSNQILKLISQSSSQVHPGASVWTVSEPKVGTHFQIREGTAIRTDAVAMCVWQAAASAAAHAQALVKIANERAFGGYWWGCSFASVSSPCR